MSNTLSLWIHDDGILGGPAEYVSSYIQQFLAVLPQATLSFNMQKSKLMYNQAINPRVLEKFPTLLSKQSNYNFTYLGTAFGDKPFKHEFFRKLYDRLEFICTKVADMPDPQSSHILLSQCLGYCRIAYCMSVQSPNDIYLWLVKYDELLFTAYQSILGVSMTAHERMILRLPKSKAGFGIRCTYDHILPTFLASRLFTHQRIVDILHLSFNPKLIDITLNQDNQFTESYIRTINNKQITNKLFNNQSNIIPTQQQLSKHITDILWNTLLSRTTSAEGITHLLSSRAYAAGAMLDAIPTSPQTTMAPTYFRMACLIRLNHRFLDEPKRCSMRAFRKTIDVYCFHTLHCTYGGDALLMHYKLCQIIMNWSKRARFRPVSEKQNLFHNEMRPADIFIECFEGGMPLCIDVGVMSPLGVRYLSANKKRKPGFASRDYETKKQNKYRTLCRKQNMHFLPFIVESLGCIGNEANKFMSILANIFAAKSHSPVDKENELCCRLLAA